MLARELLEEIEEVLTKLRAANIELPIIVEGEADVQALRKIGMEGDIISINKGIPLFNFCEELAKKYSEVIILTDWDRKGDQLKKVLSEGLKANDLYFNTEVRAKLAGLCRKETKDVEGLPGFIARLNLRIKDMN